jgi:hypothetical protein
MYDQQIQSRGELGAQETLNRPPEQGMIHAAAPTTFKSDDKARPSTKIALWSSKQGSSGGCVHTLPKGTVYEVCFWERERERERESFIRNNLHNGVVSGAARGQALLGPMWAGLEKNNKQHYHHRTLLGPGG